MILPNWKGLSVLINLTLLLQDTLEAWSFKAAEIKHGVLSSCTPQNWSYSGQPYTYNVQSMSFASI